MLMALIPEDNLLTIGRFAAATGLSHKALRIYDEIGLLSPSYTDPFTGYRYYEVDQVQHGQFIRQMREMEMPLKAIRAVLGASLSEAERLLTQYQREFNHRTLLVGQMTRQLIHFLRQEETNMTLSVESRELYPQQVVCIAGHVLVKDIDTFIKESLGRLLAFVEQQDGRITGPPVGIYHGQINEVDDGPLEVCFPVAGAFTATGDIQIRELPGGPAAVVSIRDDYLTFPMILQAYDAAHDWIATNGYEMAEPPREVWQTPVEEGGPWEIIWRYNTK